MTNKRIQLSTNVDGQNVNVYPVTKSEFVEFSDGKTLNDKLNNIDGNHEHGLATPAKDGFMSKEDKAKLDGVNNYTHPSTHAATIITEDATHRFVTDAEKTKWNNKADTTMASKTNAGLMSASDKQRIDGLNAEFKTRDDKITKNTEDIKSWNDEMVNKEYQYFNGENITINNSIVSKTTDMVIKGRTLQNLEPSHNLYMNIGSWNTFTNGSVSMYKPNTKYTVIVIVEDNKLNGEAQFIGDDNNVQTVFKTGINLKIASGSTGVFSKTYTTKDDLSNCVRVGYWVHDPNSITGTLRYSMLILEGDWTNKPIPQYFEGIKSFGQQEDKISILSHGKNLLNINNFTDDKFLSYNDGSIQELREGRCITEKFYELPENIVLSSSENLWKGFWIYDVNFKFIRNVESPNDVLVTKQSNEKYYRIGIQELRESILSKKVQLEERTIKTEYEPYKDDKKDILLSQYGFDEGLRGLNTTVYDELNDVRDMAIKRVGKHTFTGNETSIVKWATVKDENFIGFYITNDDIPNLTSKRSLVVCNNFPSVNGVITKRNMYIAVNSVNICIEKNALATPDIEGFKIWLKANPTTIYYELAKPIEIPLEEDINLKTFNERTYITSDNIIKGDLSFTVPMNTAANLENNTTRLNTIEDYVDNNKDNINKISKLEEGAVTHSLNIIDLQKEIKNENNYTNYEGTNIAVDNLSKNSRTSNMIIRGKTLQNLIKNESYDLKSLPITLENNYFTFTTDGNFQFRNIISNEKNLVHSTEYTIIYEIKENTLSEGNYVEVCNRTNFNSSVVIDNTTKQGIYSKRILTKSELDEAGHALYFSSSINNTPGQILKLRVMLVKGNLTDIPKLFEGIKSFGEAEQEGDKYKISILSTGKNLMNPKKLNESIKIKENEITFTASSNAINEFKGNEKTQYTFSCSAKKNSPSRAIESTHTSLTIFYTDGTSQRIRLVSENEPIDVYKNIKVVSEPSKTIKGFSVWGYDNTSTLSDFMIEEGTKVTSFEPYKYDKKDILIKEPLREGDYLYEDNGQVKVYRDVKQYTFTGDENFKLNASRGDYIRFIIDTLPKCVDTGNSKIFSNNFPSNADSITKETVLGYKDAGIVFCILKSKLSSLDVEGFKA